MPLEHRFEQDGLGVVVEGSGVLAGEELIAMNEYIYAPERLDRLRYQIVDLTRIERSEVTDAQRRHCAEQDRLAAMRNPAMRIVIVCSTDLQFGLARMWEAYASGPLLKSFVCRTVPEARDWIGASGALADPAAGGRD